jgi:hypothetical protein
MNDDVTALRSVIPAYAGHGDAQARRLSDMQVRAWTGESLVDLQDRLTMGGLTDRFERLLLRCEFGDQHVIKALEGDAFGEHDAAAAIEAADRKLIDEAVRGRSVAADGLDGFITELERAFDERAQTVTTLLKR